MNSGEPDSSGSGSGSSPSERLSDELQAYSSQNTQSSEVTTNGALLGEDVNDSVKILTEKLSAAVATIHAKEESVKQHAKVAEDAVAGWEIAEKEVITLKQQLDVAIKKNSSLEDKIAHLDEALKECLRQLRQAREEQDRKIQEAITKKSQDSEPNKSELESQLADLCAQLEMANAKAEATASLESHLRLRLGLAEKENMSLQIELQSRLQELEVRTLERDLSTKTAETASKHNLESIKRVAKLEAECRRLKTMLRKATSFHDHKLFAASPSYVGSLTDSQSDSGERSEIWSPALLSELDVFKQEKAPSKNVTAPSPEIGLMDDFLEMERLAALPARESGSCSLGSVTSIDKHTIDSEPSLKTELETMINRTAELEEKIEMLQAEKAELGFTLTQSQDRLKLSEGSLKQMQAKFNECQNQLWISQAQLRDANTKMGMLQAELDLANELRQAIEMELEDANVRREEAESQLRDIDNESELLLSRVAFLESEVEKEKSSYSEVSTKCQALEDELSRMKHEAETHQRQLSSINVLKEAVERELLSANAKKAAVESQLEAVQSEIRSLLTKIDSLEDEVEKRRQESAEFATKCRESDDELSRVKRDAESWKNQLASANESKRAAEQELQKNNSQREEVESQLQAVQANATSLLTKIISLEQELEKERTLSAEFEAKCRQLEEKLSRMKHDLQLAPLTKEELNIHQEKELAAAAGKLAECQKTIASLGNQLKSLAMLDDLFLDPDKLPEISDKDSQVHQNAVEITSG